MPVQNHVQFLIETFASHSIDAKCTKSLSTLIDLNV